MHVIGAVHVELPQWIRAGFLTPDNLSNMREMRELAEALLRPEAVAVLKCKGRDKVNTVIAQGNAAEDHERAVGYEIAYENYYNRKISVFQ